MNRLAVVAAVTVLSAGALAGIMVYASATREDRPTLQPDARPNLAVTPTTLRAVVRPTLPPAREQGYSEDDIEYQLAVVAGAGFSDESVEPYDAGLDVAERVCTQSRERIADIVVRASQLADERSLDMPILDLLVALPQAVPAELWPTDCAEIAAALVVLAGN